MKALNAGKGCGKPLVAHYFRTRQGLLNSPHPRPKYVQTPVYPPAALKYLSPGNAQSVHLLNRHGTHLLKQYQGLICMFGCLRISRAGDEYYRSRRTPDSDTLLLCGQRSSLSRWKMTAEDARLSFAERTSSPHPSK